MCVSSVNMGVNRWSGDYLRVVDVKNKHHFKKQLPAYTGLMDRIPVGWVLFRESGERYACRGAKGAFKLSHVR